MRRYELTAQQWRRLQPLLPPQRSKTGRSADDYRTIINGILWVLRTGARWRDLPERYGPWQRVAHQYYRWRASGLWDRILSAVQPPADQRGQGEGPIPGAQTPEHGNALTSPKVATPRGVAPERPPP